jgi:hypothetical protein
MFISRGTWYSNFVLCPCTPPKYLVNNMNYGINYYEVRLQPARPFSPLCLNIPPIFLSLETINLIAYRISCIEGQFCTSTRKEYVCTFEHVYTRICDLDTDGPGGRTVRGGCIAGNAGSNFAGSMDVCFLWVLRVARGSPRGPIPRA